MEGRLLPVRQSTAVSADQCRNACGDSYSVRDYESDCGTAKGWAAGPGHVTAGRLRLQVALRKSSSSVLHE